MKSFSENFVDFHRPGPLKLYFFEEHVINVLFKNRKSENMSLQSNKTRAVIKPLLKVHKVHKLHCI